MSQQAQNKIDYGDISEIVEYLVKVKSHIYTFDCYASDDIGQEIRLICFKALNHFDISKVDKSKWVNFFGRCVDNGLKNLKRDNYVRFNQPCPADCEFLHCEDADDEFGNVCKRWLKFKENLKRKLSIKNTVSLENLSNILRSPETQQIEFNDSFSQALTKLDKEVQDKVMCIMNGKRRKFSLNEKEAVNKIFIDFFGLSID